MLNIRVETKMVILRTFAIVILAFSRKLHAKIYDNHENFPEMDYGNIKHYENIANFFANFLCKLTDVDFSFSFLQKGNICVKILVFPTVFAKF
jgi:hypothetical protein